MGMCTILETGRSETPAVDLTYNVVDYQLGNTDSRQSCSASQYKVYS